MPELTKIWYSSFGESMDFSYSALSGPSLKPYHPPKTDDDQNDDNDTSDDDQNDE